MAEYGGYNIESDGVYGMKIIKTIGRGSLPIELRGSFSNETTARKAIDIVRYRKDVIDGEVVNTN